MKESSYNPGPDTEDENFTMTQLEASILANNYTSPNLKYVPEDKYTYDKLWWMPTVGCFLLAIAVLLVFRQ